MQNSPRAVVHCFYSTFHGVPRRCSTISPTTNCIFYSLCFGSPFSAAALSFSEKPDRVFSYRKIPEKLRPCHGSKEPHSCYLEVSVDRGMCRSRSPLGGSESVNVKSKLKCYSGILRDCAAEIRLREGKVVHGCIIRSGTKPDLHLWVSLINFYAKCGELRFSRHVLEHMAVKDAVAWTALISGFVAQGRGMESIELFCEMRRDGVRPNEFTLANILKGCSLSFDLEFGKQTHAEVVKIGVLSDVYIGSSLIDLYFKCREMEYAHGVFCLMPEKNVVLWNTLLHGYAEAGNGETVLRLFCNMEELDMKLSNCTLSIVLKGIATSGAIRAGQAVHSIVIKVAGELDDFVRCSLLNMYSKCGVAYDAFKVFKSIKTPDIVAWSSIICVFDQRGAANLFNRMRHFGVRPNEFTLSSLISAATDLGDPRYGQSIHSCAHKCGFESDNLVGNALVAMYMKFRSTNDGYLIFKKMANLDVVSWNALLSGFHDDESSGQGTSFFSQMLTDGFRPNMYTYISILRCCASLLNIEFGRQIHSRIIKDNVVGEGYVGTALIHMYAKCGYMEDVEVCFSRLNNKDVFTWTAIISSYSQTNQGEKAIECFNLMRREGFTPNEFTLASCLRGCSVIANLGNGRQFHSFAIKAGHSTEVFVSTTLIDMYGKCGYIDDAEILFKGMQSHDTVLWNTIICGYSQHGEGEKALQAFNQMIEDGMSPDRITFLGILSACSHMGFVEEGRSCFYSMNESYGISPTIEHYACLVDILGRAGNLDEVERLIEHMELTPNALIWENVLGACKAHGNVELGERAAEKLFQIDPETASNYIMLSNLYASRRRWNDVSRVRESMSSKGIKKKPGCSWLEVGAQVHVFSSQDASHPRLLDIHRKLDELGQRASDAGYMPNTSYALHNVTEKEKVDNLFNHSERLALGFALINKVNSKRTIIFKNLRICGDCHEFIKFVSSTMDREIVVRDTSCFHYFRHGLCSCKDYW